jgi:hypothetical protein
MIVSVPAGGSRTIENGPYKTVPSLVRQKTHRSGPSIALSSHGYDASTRTSTGGMSWLAGGAQAIVASAKANAASARRR